MAETSTTLNIFIVNLTNLFIRSQQTGRGFDIAIILRLYLYFTEILPQL
jgi:hypothetical protein